MSDSASVIDSRAAGETEAGSTGQVSGGGGVGGGSADEDNVRSSVAAEQQAVSASSAVGELHSSGINPRQAPPQPLRQVGYTY